MENDKPPRSVAAPNIQGASLVESGGLEATSRTKQEASSF